MPSWDWTVVKDREVKDVENKNSESVSALSFNVNTERFNRLPALNNPGH